MSLHLSLPDTDICTRPEQTTAFKTILIEILVDESRKDVAVPTSTANEQLQLLCILKIIPDNKHDDQSATEVLLSI